VSDILTWTGIKWYQKFANFEAYGISQFFGLDHPFVTTMQSNLVVRMLPGEVSQMSTFA